MTKLLRAPTIAINGKPINVGHNVAPVDLSCDAYAAASNRVGSSEKPVPSRIEIFTRLRLQLVAKSQKMFTKVPLIIPNRTAGMTSKKIKIASGEIIVKPPSRGSSLIKVDTIKKIVMKTK